jgi:lambda family phage portal protein
MGMTSWLRETARKWAGPQATSLRSGSTASQWLADWALGTSSINRTLMADLAVTRQKSRDVAFNTGTGARIAGIWPTNVSGKDGILYQGAITTAAGELDAERNSAAERAWYQWAEDPKSVTADEKLTWQEVEQLTDRTEGVDGETLVRLLPGFRNRWGFAVQVLDPDQLDLTYHQDPAPGRNAIIMGVEVNQWGAPVAYHLWPNHPSDVIRRGERMRVPASQILHNFLTHRAGQARGIPWTTPVLADIMHLAKYREAEVVAARLAAAKMGFIKGGDGSGTSETMDATPGRIPKLGADEDFVSWDPNHPNGNHAQFERVILQSVASAVNISHMSLSGDLSGTSFSSGQMGYLQEKDMYRLLQQRRVIRYSRPVHRAWLEMALVSGRLNLRGSLDELAASNWRARPFQPIDPLKASKTDALNVALGRTSLTDLVEEDGGDLRTVLLKRKAEIELARQLGVPLYLPVGSAVLIDDPADDAAPPAPADREASAPSLSLALERVA